MLMLFVSIVFLSACQPFVFANIPEDEIPDYIKESIKDLGSDDSKAKDIVWRVCEERRITPGLRRSINSRCLDEPRTCML